MTVTPKRRWYQFSLKTLMNFMVACSLVLASLGWRLQRANKQAVVVKQLRALGCNVQYDYDFERTKDGGFRWASKRRTWLPAALIKWPGEDFFHDVHAMNANTVQPKSPQDVEQFWKLVVALPALHHFQLEGQWLDHDGFSALRGNRSLQHVYMVSNDISDEDLRVAGTIPKLRQLHLLGPGAKISDEGIAAFDELGELQSFGHFNGRLSDESVRHLALHPKLTQLQLSGNKLLTDASTVDLAKLTELQQLAINGTQISDAGLANLKSLKKLTFLDVADTKVTDEGLAHLAGMTELQALNLPLTKVHGPGLAHLRNLPKLDSVNCMSNAIADDDLRYFSDLPMLHTLPLVGSRVTDEGIRHLQISPKVTRIELASTKITDKSLEVLAKYPQLKSIWISGTGVTPAGVATFQKALPLCNVQ